MNFGIVFLTLAFQVILALIVIAVLMDRLSRELIEVALEQLDASKHPQENVLLKEIIVISHAPLNDATSYRFKAIVARKFKGVPLSFFIDNTIKGGVKIMVGENVIDCSSKKRLEKLWGARG